MLLTKENRAALPPLGSQDGKGDAAVAFVKFFDPTGSWSWFATEASATLSDGREVSLAEADAAVRDVRNGGGARQVPKASGTNDMRGELSEPTNSNNAGASNVGLRSGAEQPELARRADAVVGLRLPANANAPTSVEGRLRKTGGLSAGEGNRTAVGEGRNSAPQEQRAGRRQADEFGIKGAGGTSTGTHTGQGTAGPVSGLPPAPTTPPERPLQIEDVTFFGLVDGHEAELGYFSLSELSAVKGRFGLGIERDRHFPPTTIGELQAKIDARGSR